ncbi:MAG: Asp-tRNA(Asn)/Glu-tRNA(Gln) amidotransferase subunit GatC [bacterium]
MQKEQIEQIANLARIKLSENEKDKYIKQFSDILEYFEQLKEVDTENIEPLINANLSVNSMREDRVESCDKSITDKIIEQVPEKKDRYVKVKKVL